MRVEIRQTGIFSASSSVFTLHSHWHHDLHHHLHHCIVSIFQTFLQRSTMTNLSSCSSLIPLSLPSAANSAFIIIDYETSSNTGLKYLKKIYIVFQSNGVKKVNVKKITLTTSPQVVSSTIPLIHFSLLFTRKGTWPGLKNNNDRKRHR